MYDIIKGNTQDYHTGMLVPDKDVLAKCELTAIEDTPMMLTDSQINEIFASGSADKRDIFDSSYILDQKSHGSCCGFGCAGALSKARVRRNMMKVILSGAFIYSRINGGSDNGGLLEDGRKELMEVGTCPQAICNWDAIYPNRQSSECKVEAAKYKGFECYKAGTIQGFWTGIALQFDAVVAVHVSSRFTKLDGEGIAGADSGPGNHCVHVDGGRMEGSDRVGNGVNSWNITYGDNGRMGLTDNHFKQTFPNHVFFLIRCAEANPDEKHPPILK